MIPKWCNDYVGMPFVDRGRDKSGCDCWGLVRLVLHERFNIAVKCFADDYRDAKDGDSISKICVTEKELWSKVDKPKAGDVILLLIKGLPWHIGIVVDPPWMLHVERGADAVMEKYDNLMWRNRIEGFYRYAG